MEKFARNVRPEFLKNVSDASLGGHDQAIGKGMANAGIARRIVEIGQRAGSDVAADSVASGKACRAAALPLSTACAANYFVRQRGRSIRTRAAFLSVKIPVTARQNR
jgi:hypothetical protein